MTVMTLLKFAFLIVTCLFNLGLILAHSQECGEAELKGRDGILTSPNYPNQYPEKINCSWFIKPPINTTAIVVMTHVDLEDDECTISTGSGLIYYKQPCGEGRIISTNLIRISFRSTNVHRRKGFRLIFSIRNRTICEGSLSCVDKSGCFNSSDSCDSPYKCADHSDKINCANCMNNRAPCNSTSNVCFDPKEDRCDGIMHCPNGEDEMNCPEMCPGRIQCLNGFGCYTVPQICDRKPTCIDNSDEVNCTQRLCPAKGRYFLCDNRKCISTKLVYDGVDDCGDLSDEQNVNKADKTPIFIFTAFILAMSFLVLMCRWHGTRRDIHNLMENPPQFPLPPFRGPDDFSYVGCNIQLSDSDFRHGGEIYEAFVRTRRQARHERSLGHFTTTFSLSEIGRYFEDSDPSCATAALASLGINAEACLGKYDFLEECWDSCEVCLQNTQLTTESKGRSRSGASGECKLSEVSDNPKPVLR